jgi:hypothetical protein
MQEIQEIVKIRVLQETHAFCIQKARSEEMGQILQGLRVARRMLTLVIQLVNMEVNSKVYTQVILMKASEGN